MKRKSITARSKVSGKTGSAMIETVAGLFILAPIFLLLVDVIALVIAQSVNDDLAKQAARYAAQTTLILQGDNVTPDTTAMQKEAEALAVDYLQKTTYFGAVDGLVFPVPGQQNPLFQACNCNFASNPPQVQVITEIRCNLPVAVPFGGPKFTTFQAQQTYPIVGLQPKPN